MNSPGGGSIDGVGDAAQPSIAPGTEAPHTIGYHDLEDRGNTATVAVTGSNL